MTALERALEAVSDGFGFEHRGFSWSTAFAGCRVHLVWGLGGIVTLTAEETAVLADKAQLLAHHHAEMLTNVAGEALRRPRG